jgi:hypothetical protein
VASKGVKEMPLSKVEDLKQRESRVRKHKKKKEKAVAFALREQSKTRVCDCGG